MKGNIYTREKCPICKGPLVHDERRGGCFCQKHLDIRAGKGFYMKFGKDINKRFKTYEQAYHYLIGLRYEVEQNKFDVRDHIHANPLGFSNLANNYLKFKESQSLASFYHIKRYMNRAADYFQDTNVKEIKKRHLRSFLDSMDLADKSKANYASQLHDFFYTFLYEEEEILEISQLPKFPKVDYELGFRKIIDIKTREKIIDKVKDMTYARNPKAWLAIDILSSYSRLRPLDVRRLKEGDIDLEYGVLTFWRPTKSKRNSLPKVIRIRMLDFHIEEFKKLKKQYPALDEVLFFRHPNGEPFGVNILYKTWKKACGEIGVEGLDLYGGTRHSNVTAIAKATGRENARKHSGHMTNKAFDRYCQIGDDDTFNLDQLMATIRGKGAGNVVDFKSKKKGEK